VMSVVGNFQLFAEPYVMTQGGPGHSTLSIVLYMYEEGFRWWSLGYAAALAFVLFAIVVAVTLLTRLRARAGLSGLRPPEATAETAA
jgi:multiple sugar transport system permease protein